MSAADYYQGSSAPPPQGSTAEYQDQPKYYQQQQQQPPQYGQNYGPATTQGGWSEKPTFDQAFKLDKPKYNDLWAAILFLAVFAAFVAVSGITLNGYTQTIDFNGGIYGGGNTFGLSSNTVIGFAFVLAMAIVLSYAYIWLARLFTKQFIWITGILNIVWGFATAIYMLSRRYWSGGIVFLLFAVFSLICFISWIKRIPFSVLMLQTAVDVSKKYGHVYVVSFVGGFVATAFAAWYSVTLVAIYVKYQPGNNPACDQGAGGCGNGKVIGLIVLVTFAAYYTSEVIKNVIHVTISGVYGSWYFCSQNFPKAATRGAFRRAMTYSFGSISFGSLIVAIINCLRQICSVAQSQAGGDGNIVGYVLFCVLQCLISILDWAVQFINRYAFAHIALYGKSYIQAAKDTWRMIKDRGIDALINECLVGPVFSMGAVFVGFATALLAYLYLVFTDPAYNRDGGFTPVVVAFAFLIGVQICNTFTQPLSSGLETIFVACAWDPQVLMRDHPDLYARMISVYPHVQTAIHA